MKKQGRKCESFELDLIDKYNNVASANECTGLIQIPPSTEAEAESYGDIYIIPNQVNDFKNVKKPKGRSVKSAPGKN